MPTSSLGLRAGSVPGSRGHVLAAFLSLAPVMAQQNDQHQAPIAAAPARGWFVANAGQWAPDIAFGLQHGGAGVWLDARGIRLDLEVPDEEAPPAKLSGAVRPALDGRVTATRAATLRLSFGSGAPVTPIGEQREPTVAHFQVGNDPSRWCSDVPTYRAVRWPDVLPGAAVRARSHADGLLEFELELAAGCDPAALVLAWQGVDGMRAEEDGSVHLAVGGATVRQSAAVAWQPGADGRRLDLPVRLQLLGDDRFRFVVEGARPDLPIVIDPVLTYHGGLDNEGANGVARDAQDRVYVAGRTFTPGIGSRDVMVSCLDCAVAPPVTRWTYTFGGSADEQGFDIDIDSAGLLTVVGFTTSTDFRTVNPLPGQSAFGGGQLDGFVTQLAPNGASPPSIMHSTYLGGAGDDWCCRVVMDAQLRATVAGCTSSTNFPVVNPLQAYGGQGDAFVTQIPVAGGSISYSTYFGGAGGEAFLYTFPSVPIKIREVGLDVDAAGRILVGGPTTSTDATFPLRNPFQGTNGGLQDGFAAILDPAAGAGGLVWSTFLGGSSNEGVYCARFGPRGEVVLGGYTYSSDFPLSSVLAGTPFQSTADPQVGTYNDAFVCWLDPQAQGAGQLLYSTYLGGSESDIAMALAVDQRGHATVVGYCGAAFPNGGWPADAGGHQLAYGGNLDGFVVRLRPAGRARQDLTYGTYIGGNGFDLVLDVELEPDGGAALAGSIGSAGVAPLYGALTGPRDMLAGRLELLPGNVQRGLAGSSPGCAGAMLLEVDRQPVAGAPFEFLIGNAPPGALGGLVFGGPQPCATTPYGGLLCVNPILVTAILTSGATTAASLSITVPSGMPLPIPLEAQALWLDATGCAQPLVVVSSAVLSF